MTREERAAYMREWRRRNPAPRKRRDLDRSKPIGRNVKLDRPAYMRQYMRWKRAGCPQ